MSELLPGPTKSECGCSKNCGKFGTPNRWGCVRGCPCPRCVGKRNRKSGLKKQGAARKALGVPGGKFGASNEELWESLFRNECKSGRFVMPAANAYLKIEQQVDANRPDVGDDGRPCRAIIMPFGWGSEGLVMVRLSTWQDLIRPALEAHYGAT
jgi:hypothetical protein